MRREPTLRSALSSRLFLATSLPAADGTIFALAARGDLASPAGAAFVGLGVVAGASAWISARREFRAPSSFARLAVVALLSVASVVAAAWAGEAVGARLDLAWFTPAAGVALLGAALETAGATLPRLGSLPFPALALAAGALAEVARWTL